MIGCRLAREILSMHALGAPEPAERVAEAHDHMAGCAACRHYLARFGNAIASSDADEIPCSEVRSRLDHDRAGGGEGMGAVRAHIERCPACAAEAAAWERVTVLAAQHALAEPPRYPVFDLSFLPQVALADVWAQARAGVRRFAYDIQAALALAGQTLFSPPPGLAVSYATIQAPRRARGKAGKDQLVTMSVDDPQQDVRISLNVSGAEKAMWLAVTMRMLSSGHVLTGARVALCNEHGQAQEIKTVRSNEVEVRFPDITPGRYLVRVEKSGKMWELPVVL